MRHLPLALPVIDPKRCDGCGACARSCPTNAVTLVNGLAQITAAERCTFCEICENSCPCNAIGRPFSVEHAPESNA